MKDWKTTLSGAFAALGLLLQQTPNEKVHAIGTIIAAIGVIVFAHSAKDKNPTTPIQE